MAHEISYARTNFDNHYSGEEPTNPMEAKQRIIELLEGLLKDVQDDRISGIAFAATYSGGVRYGRRGYASRRLVRGAAACSLQVLLEFQEQDCRRRRCRVPILTRAVPEPEED